MQRPNMASNPTTGRSPNNTQRLILMNILHLLATADPRSGGPIECVRQSSATLTAMGHHVEIVTLDDPEALYLSTFPLIVHALGPSRGNYKFSPRLVPWL